MAPPGHSDPIASPRAVICVHSGIPGPGPSNTLPRAAVPLWGASLLAGIGAAAMVIILWSLIYGSV